jgi:hypothetical protein
MRNFVLASAAIAVMAAGGWWVSQACESGKAAQAAGVSAAASEPGVAKRRAPAESAAPVTARVAVAPGGAYSSRDPVNTAAARSGGGTASWHESDANAGCLCCDSWTTCHGELARAGAGTQVVSMKNGVMYVHTAEAPAGVRATQLAVARHHERLEAQAAGGDKIRLCPGCRMLRGATASGKLQHEVLNVEGGCIMVMTSSDPAVVAMIYAEAGVASPARAKI